MLLLGPPHTIPGIAMLTLLSCNVLCHAQTKFNVIVEDFPCAPVVRELARTPALAEGSRPTLEPDYIHLRRFIDCEAQIVALGMWPGDDEKQWIYGYRAPEISKTAYVVGIARAIAVVNRSNPVNSLDYDQLRKILAGDGQNVTWADVGGRGGGAVKVYGEANVGKQWAMSRKVLWRTALRKWDGYEPRGYFPFGKNWNDCHTAEHVLEKVKADASGIGFVLWAGELPKDVKVLAIAKDKGDAAVMPADGAFIQKDYPLVEPLVLYLHPTQPDAAKKFCEFAMSREGAAVIEKFGLITPRMQFEAESKIRLADLKSGKGDKVAACGAVGGSNALAGRAVREMMGGLAEEFVRAKAVVQVGYTPMATDVAGMGAFLATTGAGEASC